MFQHASAQRLIAALVCAASGGTAFAGGCMFGTNLDNITNATGFGAAVPSFIEILCVNCGVGECVYTDGQYVCHRFTLDVDSLFAGFELGIEFDYEQFNHFGIGVYLFDHDKDGLGPYTFGYGTLLDESRITPNVFGPGRHLAKARFNAAPYFIPAGEYTIIVATTSQFWDGEYCNDRDFTDFRILSAEMPGADTSGFVLPVPTETPWFSPAFWPPDFDRYRDNQPFNPAIRLLFDPIPQPDWICNPACPGDADGDGRITLRDLNTVLMNFGREVGDTCANGDVNTDCRVDLYDVFIVAEFIGTPCL